MSALYRLKTLLSFFELLNYNYRITNYKEAVFSELPTRGEYQIHAGDILLALNNSSRGTVVLVPKEFDNAICTSGFLVIVPKNEDEGFRKTI